MRKKLTITVFVIAFLTGLLLGILMIDDIRNEFSKYAIYLYVVVIIGSIIFVNMNCQRLSKEVYFFPLVALTMYLPVNILAGVYFSNRQWRYYSSFPRFGIILYYLLFLLILYLFARGIAYLLKIKQPKIIYVVTDILSLSALPILLFVTYFSSPA